MTPPLDTSREAAARQHAALRAMAPSRRLEIALAMSLEVRQLAEAGIRRRHPDYADERVMEALADVLLGPELAEAVRDARSAARR